MVGPIYKLKLWLKRYVIADTSSVLIVRSLIKSSFLLLFDHLITIIFKYQENVFNMNINK